MNVWKKRMSAMGIGALLLGAVLAGCGGGGSSTEAGASGTTSGQSGSGSTGGAKQYLAKWIKGTNTPPKVSQVTPPENKTVWVIEVGAISVSSQNVALAFTENAAQLGWKVKVFDGKFEPNVWQEGIRSAVAANADAIAVYAIDCASVTSPLKEAKAAGIPVIGIESVDCSEEGGEQLFTYNVTYAPGNGSMIDTQAPSLGNAQGAWVAAERPTAKILKVYETDLKITVGMAEGFDETIEKYCPGCEVVETIEMVGTELGPELQNKVEQALLRHPEVDVVYGNYDELVSLSIAPAIRNIGRAGQIAVIGCEGQKPNIKLMYENQMAAGAGLSNLWEGYAALDATIRILAGKKPVGNSGEGVQLFDIDHNMPAEGEAYAPTTDFKTPYREAWGIQ